MEVCRNTALYMEKLQMLLDAGAEAPLPVQGGSMAPFLVSGRDQVWLKKPAAPLRAGEIVLYRRRSGAYILHRIQKCGAGSFTMLGDAHSVPEPGIRPEQIMGVVVRVRRKGRILGPDSLKWKFFARIWRRIIPLRHPIMSAVNRLHKLTGRVL